MTIRVSTVQADVAIIEDTNTVQVSTVQADVMIIQDLVPNSIQISNLQADVMIDEITNTVQISTLLGEVMYIPHIKLGTVMGTFVKVKNEVTGTWDDVITCSKQKVA